MSASIPQDTALELQLAAIAGREPEGGLYEVRYKLLGKRSMGQLFEPIEQQDSLVDTIQALAQKTDVYIGCAPRRERSGRRDAVENVWCLWTDVDGPDALERLREFRPLPHIVIASGSPDAVHAWWSLRDPLRPEQAERANKRLAHQLGADPKATDAARILRPAGTRYHKHAPPVAVRCIHLRISGRSPTADEILDGVPELEPEPPAPMLRRTRERQSDSPWSDPLLELEAKATPSQP